MNQLTYDNLSKQYSPLIKWLIESNSFYVDIHFKVRWCFGWDNNTAITATVNRETNLMSVNVFFVDEAYKENKIYNVEYYLLHEMRHIYQHNQIKEYRSNNHSIDPVFIERWIKEGNGYIKALDEKGEENIDYYKQDCELDAYAFSYAAMKHKYKGLYDSVLFVPKIYLNELKEEFDKAVNDFIESWD